MRWWGLFISLGTFVVGTLFPAYKSVEALESSGTLDDSQWLTYWLLSSFLTIVERFGYRVLFKMPFYGECKLAILAWLALPMFNGASLIYRNARPYLIDFYSALRQTTDELRNDENEEEELKGMRLRITKVRANVAQALQDMYVSVYKRDLDGSRLTSKLDELETTMGISSDSTKGGSSAGTGAQFASGGADLLSGGGDAGYNASSGMGTSEPGFTSTSGMGATGGTGMGATGGTAMGGVGSGTGTGTGMGSTY